jgi:anaerobic selenocysteine-containing dehydrogenase
LFARGPDQRDDWEICLELWSRLCVPRPLGRALRPILRRVGPEGILEAALRLGPHRLSLRRLRAAPHGLDLGPLESRFPGRLRTPGKRIDVAPRRLVADLPRLRTMMRAAPAELVLIGRRQLRSNNSWCHNSARLVKGKPRCTLLMHPRDAAARGITSGETVELASKTGGVRVPVEVSDEIMAGVVSLPHGWGHDRPGTRLGVARSVPGVSVNDVTSEDHFDALSGTAALSGLAVEVRRA